MPTPPSARSTGSPPVPSPITPAYSATARVLHWSIAALVLLQFGVSLLMPEIGPGVVPGTLINLHLSLGIVVLVLMACRLVYRLGHAGPAEDASAPAWERLVARATHAAFYIILLVGPFLGWASASAHRLPVTVFGVLSLPDLAAPKARWALTAGDVHATLMWALLALIALHAAAALVHHFLWRDGVLRRMWPASAR